MKKALVVVDAQRDFCANGKLAVKDGDEVIDPINKLMLSGKYDLIVATLDWHPQDHKSFASNNNKPVGSMGELNGQPQVMWPDHCVQNSQGAMFHSQLKVELIDHIIKKGTNPEVDSYSGFFDNDQKSATGLGDFLKTMKIEEVDVVGLALDYCVKFTAEDAKRLGFKTNVIVDATRAVNLSPKDGENAIKDLKKQNIGIK